MLKQGQARQQSFTFPILTLWRATERAVTGAAQVFHGHLPHDIFEFGFFLLACAGAVGAFRRLPLAYGAYAAVGIVFLSASLRTARAWRRSRAT